MKKVNQIYKCNVCGNIIELTFVGGGELVCCGQPMEFQEEKSGEEGTEKHRPVIDGAKVSVGSVPHPMESEHFIEWVETVDGDDICRKTLEPGDKPEAEFCEKSIKKARAFCNVHGLWKN